MEISVARVERWLSDRYGAEAHGDEAVRRAATILGIRHDGAGAVTAVCLRLDAEREYERDPDGKFASTGGGGEGGRKAGEGVGAAGNHAEVAASHAGRARTAAAGTTPSARASARKAEEHAALAKVAAEFGDHEKAGLHAREAERHSVTAQLKASAHRGERATLPVPNRPMAQMVAEHARSQAPAALSPAERQRTEAVHRQMAELTPKVTTPPPRAPRAPAPPTTPIPDRHAAISDDHLAKIVQKAADEAPGRHGYGDEKVFVHRVHEATQGQHGLTLDAFKERLKGLNSSGRVVLARADLVGAMNHHDVTKSEIVYPGVQTHHFVRRSTPISPDEVHRPPRGDVEFHNWRMTEHDHSGRPVAEKTQPADRQTIPSPAGAKVGDRITVPGGWQSTLYDVRTHADGSKTYSTGSGDFHESHFRRQK